MDVLTEQAYQERIAELTHQLAVQDAAVVELRAQLAQRGAVIAELRTQLAPCDATIAALQQQVDALSKQVAELLAQSHQALQKMLPDQAVINVDETGHKTNGRPHWTWCFRAAQFTCSQQQRSVFEFLHQTVGNHFAGLPTPSLLPSGP